jgi:hypothetical protein
VPDLDAELVLEGLDHCARASRAADDDPLQRAGPSAGGAQIANQANPQRRHAERNRHGFCLDQLGKCCAVQARAGEQQPRSSQRRRIGDAPGIGVKHRCGRQHAVCFRKPGDIGQGNSKGVQDLRTMTVEHALGIARRSRRVAKRGGGVLVEVRPVELTFFRGQQLFVA